MQLIVYAIKNTYIDKIIIISDEKISKNSGFVQVSQGDHVLDPMDGGRVHCLDPPLWSEPLLVAVIVSNLNIKLLFEPLNHNYRVVDRI